MATDAGIEMSECRLFLENDRRHFMTRRFDRHADGKKIHTQSLCALAHFDFNLAGAHSYEQAFMVMSKLGLPMEAIEQQFRRMVFNIVTRNQDDHVKNIALLMDKAGQWSLAPAFDLNYSFDPANKWMARHQMTMNGKREDFALEDFKACARTVSLKRGRAERMLSEVIKVVAGWKQYADAAGVSPATGDRVQRALRLSGF